MGGNRGDNLPQVVGPDTRSKNAVIHVINNVILPPAEGTDDDQEPTECTGGEDCGSCKGECQNNGGCRFSKIGWCKRDCEERFGVNGICEGGDDDTPKVCFGGEDCSSCKSECQDNEGCGRESAGECKAYCEEKWGDCYECTGGEDCGSCKGECKNNDGCRFSKIGWCKRDCEERFGVNGICEGGDDDTPKVCFGGEDC